MPFAEIKEWSTQRQDICGEISERNVPLKIFLKTKDEPAMLLPWIEHHSRIVGFDGLVIFDNMSSNPAVEAIYDKYRALVPIYRYSGFHNLIHHTHFFASLYAAIRASCNNFIFLDTDEHLSYYDGFTRFLADPSILSFLSDRNSTPIFPGTWLQNIRGYRDHFSLYEPSIPFKHGLKWGKPIISTRSAFDAMINHNTQIEHALYVQPLITNFFVLHLSRVSKEQRINANLKKLRAYSAIHKECGLEEFLTIDLEELGSDQVKMYAREIHELIGTNVAERGELHGWIKVSSDGELTCSADWQKRALVNFLLNPQEYASELFS